MNMLLKLSVLSALLIATSLPAHAAQIVSVNGKENFSVVIEKVRPDTIAVLLCDRTGEACQAIGSRPVYTETELSERLRHYRRIRRYTLSASMVALGGAYFATVTTAGAAAPLLAVPGAIVLMQKEKISRAVSLDQVFSALASKQAQVRINGSVITFANSLIPALPH